MARDTILQSIEPECNRSKPRDGICDKTLSATETDSTVAPTARCTHSNRSPHPVQCSVASGALARPLNETGGHKIEKRPASTDDKEAVAANRNLRMRPVEARIIELVEHGSFAVCHAHALPVRTYVNR